MSVILTNGQSFADIARDYTISPAYGPGIANYNNMPDEDIIGKKFRIEIPDTWMLPQYAGKQIDLRGASGTSGGVSPLIWGALAVGVVLLFK